MEIYNPDQKPSFLFESGRDAPEKISLGAFLSLQADRDTLMRELNTLQHHLQEVLVDLQAIGLERDDLKAMVKTHGQLSERSELTYQNIIGVLVNLFLDHSPAGKPLSVFKNQAAIVDAIIARHQDVPGLSKRTLDEKFAAANRSLKKK
ncbi:protein kinase [Pseudomonas extremaustralis]|uniref:protein kinase n=1 Tax=Pseudomonas extremaustralis TaxID=359110 RepID=UPI002AA0D723|nr:protein kinase [Pseudomonas extremaustralis]